jgi:hypothetical protein
MFFGRVREVEEREYKGEEELNPTQNSPRCRGPTKAQTITDIPGRVPTCATPRPTEPTRHSVGRQNARQCRRVALSSRRCRPSLLSRCAIHEALRLRCLGRCHSRLSLRLVLLGYVNSQLRVHYKLTEKRFYSEMADPTKGRLRPALRFGGVFGFIGGFLLAYQRSSCESPLTHRDHTHANANAPCRHLSPFLGLVGEQT